MLLEQLIPSNSWLLLHSVNLKTLVSDLLIREHGKSTQKLNYFISALKKKIYEIEKVASLFVQEKETIRWTLLWTETINIFLELGIRNRNSQDRKSMLAALQLDKLFFKHRSLKNCRHESSKTNKGKTFWTQRWSLPWGCVARVPRNPPGAPKDVERERLCMWIDMRHFAIK